MVSEFPKLYYSRRFISVLGKIGFLMGLVAVVSQLYIIFLTNHQASYSALATGGMMLALTRGHSKPRIIVTPEEITVLYNVMRPARTIKIIDIVRVENEKRFQFILKDHSQIILPKFEFNKKTRAAIVGDIHTLLNAESA